MSLLKEADAENDKAVVLQNSQRMPEIKLYKRRFPMLAIFCIYSMSSAFQWIQYAIITNIIADYYGVSELAVQWTSMIYMLAFIPLMFPATWMLDKYGLRKVVIFGAALNATGALIKIVSVQPNLFAVTFLGQTISACAQSFVLEIPPKVASVWFGPSEVSTATSIGVFGNQVGVALGFLLPPLIVSDVSDKEVVGHQLRILFVGTATVCTVILILAIAVFRDEPPHPPSAARRMSVAAASSNNAQTESIANYKRSIIALVKDVPFLLLFVTYGINTGTYYAIGTLLNPIMLPYHPDAGKEIGEIGLTMVVAGLAGSVICGYILDKTKKFKLTTVIIYGFSMVFMFVFSITLQFKHLWLDYVTIGLLGFFMTGYLPIGFEFAAEITFPESEATSSGLLNVSAQIFGIIFTMAAGKLIDTSVLTANLFMSIALLVGMILTVLIKSELKRQAANEHRHEEENGYEDDNTPEAIQGLLVKEMNSNDYSKAADLKEPTLSDDDNEEDVLVGMNSGSSRYSADEAVDQGR